MYPSWLAHHIAGVRQFGLARNPWDLTRTPGGSSGGMRRIFSAGSRQ
ncbi:amidase family protein [Aquitalea magnusonii]